MDLKINNDMAPTPLFVDLDGTLIHTDLLFEACITFLKRNPLNVILLTFWIFRGKVFLKHKLSQRININVETLPYNYELIDFLKKQRTLGRKLYLATASHQTHAILIANYLNIFDGVLASNSNVNMKGKNKLKACQQLSEKFSYAGNDTLDFILFKEAHESYLVAPTSAALRLTKKTPVTYILDKPRNSLKVFLQTIRIHQWLKNLLIFVPIVVSTQYLVPSDWLKALIGFFLLSFIASSTYILNDLLDIESDRAHPRKKIRPIPSGLLSIPQAIFLSISLFVIAVIGALVLTNIAFQLSLLAYLFLTLLYTFLLKTYVIADVISLASLFTIRIIAGAMVISVELSFWLLAFSMFTFFSLALIKRCAELKLLSKVNKKKSSGRDYLVEDFDLMQTFGVTSAFISLLLMAFYVDEAMKNGVYSLPNLLWATLPAFAYWFLRMWLKTNRGEMHDDPIVFSLKNKGSIVTIAFIVVISLLARML